MEPKFKNLPLEILQQAVDNLIYRLLQTIDADEETIDCDDLCSTLEDFAGRGYIVRTKVDNDLPLSRYDREYLTNLIDTISITEQQ